MKRLTQNHFVPVIAMVLAIIFMIPSVAFAGESKAATRKLTEDTAIITLSKTEFTYSGKHRAPQVKVKYKNPLNGKTKILERNEHYRLIFDNNVDAGTATITIKGTGKYSGILKRKYTIKRKSIENGKLYYKHDNMYLKKNLKPLNAVYVNGKKLVKDKDYKVTYKNNRYPGKGRITVKGIGNYKGKITATFNIAKVKNFRVKEKKTSKIRLAWSKRSNVSGYKIYQYKNGKYVRIATVKGADTNRYWVKNLEPATKYSFKISAYKKVNGKKYYSPASKVRTNTKIAKAHISKAEPLVCALRVEWKDQNCTGYQVCVAKDEEFKTVVRTNKYKRSNEFAEIYHLKKSKTYYVKIRAYWKHDGKVSYGKWSKAESVKTKPIGQGWNSIAGEMYYYDLGYALKGQQTIDGNSYYFSQDGVLLGATKTMWNKMKEKSSNTEWLIITDTYTNTTCIYNGYAGNWTLKKYFRCSTGAWDTPTKKGEFQISSKGYSFSDEDYTCYWWSGWYGSEYLYHSVPYVRDSTEYYRDSRIGYNISHGCIRLETDNAKWIYDNIPYHTKVITY